MTRCVPGSNTATMNLQPQRGAGRGHLSFSSKASEAGGRRRTAAVHRHVNQQTKWRQLADKWRRQQRSCRILPQPAAAGTGVGVDVGGVGGVASRGNTHHDALRMHSLPVLLAACVTAHGRPHELHFDLARATGPRPPGPSLGRRAGARARVWRRHGRGCLEPHPVLLGIDCLEDLDSFLCGCDRRREALRVGLSAARKVTGRASGG